MELTKLCAKYFDCCNLYDVLGADKATDGRKLKRAYFKRSLAFHPNSNSEKSETDEGFEKFKTLFKVYSILSDEERKWVYDKTGCVWLDEELMDNSFNWLGHWALTFKKANDSVINSFLNQYRGSMEETEDLKKLYSLYRGDVPKIMNMALFITAEDEVRIRDSIQYMSDQKHRSIKDIVKKPVKRNMVDDDGGKRKSKKVKKPSQGDLPLSTNL
ncbi:dnaJ homolog subfamily C member 9-like [Daphnia pulicaria]|uniref:dnaJ homolog subfamily C member 9-like n=1 Tax=Daphnia pulicaria TaxID=35523 RepID=UPI001EEBD04E|nr:dnaJ homolog subfamily C member 9-like [Daphnia pulicaria]